MQGGASGDAKASHSLALTGCATLGLVGSEEIIEKLAELIIGHAAPDVLYDPAVGHDQDEFRLIGYAEALYDFRVGGVFTIQIDEIDTTPVLCLKPMHDGR
jgi:hypothetical protein